MTGVQTCALPIYGALVPKGFVITSNSEIKKKIKNIGNKPVVVKAQIHAGGRGKAGGIKLVKDVSMIEEEITKMLENIALWHERDISHSSVERNIGPDANITLDFALIRLAGILDKMIIYPKRMMKNLNITKGLIFSQEIMLELTKTGISREKAYNILQDRKSVV